MMEVFSDLGLTLSLLIKVATLLFFGFYIAFSAIVVKQVNLMTQTLEVGFETPVKVVAYFHFALSVAVFLLALFIL
jgi:hypothetical protein